MHPIKDATFSTRNGREGPLFQSMHPIKDATDAVFDRDAASVKFQSMHPIKDATFNYRKKPETYGISIHAPYKGCNKK